MPEDRGEALERVEPMEEEDSVVEEEDQVEGEDRNNVTLGPAQNCQNWSKLSGPLTVAWMRSLGEV